jgi:hypothetical protein
VLAYAGCRISEALALTVHHIDAERFMVTIRTLKRRKLVYRAVPVPQAMIELLRRHADTLFWSMHRVTAWRVIKATMRLAGIAGPMACPKGLRHGFGYSRRRPQRPHEPDSALDGPCLAGHDRYLPRRHRARGTAVCQPHVVIDSGCGQSFSKSNALSLTKNAALDRLTSSRGAVVWVVEGAAINRRGVALHDLGAAARPCIT